METENLKKKLQNTPNFYPYDSKADTLEHIKRVNELLSKAAIELINRGNRHDDSKLRAPEKELFDEMTPMLKNLTFGTPEYQASLDKLAPALDHHYKNNSHHPQFYIEGVNGMDLFDIMEMFFDWKAAGERTKDGNIMKSIAINKDRFGLSDQLVKIFENTANRL